MDPRAENSKNTFLGDISQHQIDWHSLPDMKYRCSYARYVPPSLSGEKTTVVVRTPDSFHGFVSLNTGYNGGAMDAHQRILHLPGETPVLTVKFWRDKSLGPYSICLMSEDGKRVVSDTVGNLGLVDGNHTQFYIAFADR